MFGSDPAWSAPLSPAGGSETAVRAGPPNLPAFHTSSAPAGRSTCQGGFAAHPPPLRSGGLLLPPGPPFSPLVARSWRSVPRARRGFAAHPPPLRSGGLLLPPGPPFSPLLPGGSALGRRGGRASRGRGRRAGRGGILAHLGEGGQLLAGRGEVALALG